MPTYPTTRRRDALRLVARLAAARLGRGDAAATLAHWLREQTVRCGSQNVFLDLIFRRVLFVSDPGLSAFLLAVEPSTQTVAAGTMKRKAMSFLAPHALTILHNAEWRTMRAFNEAVLQTGVNAAHMPAVLAAVREAFDEPVDGLGDVRRRMGRAMLAIVFGTDRAPAGLIDDIQELFAEVNAKTAIFGSRKAALRDRFKDALHRLWEDGAGAGEPTLLAAAHEAAASLDKDLATEEMLLDQIPHWMFTFTNSGSELLFRSMEMIAARPQTLAEVRREISAAGDLHGAERMHALPLLEACILETGRLFPPVVLATHRAARPISFQGTDIPEGTEMLQFFPLANRDVTRDPLASDFRPDRWLQPDRAAFPNYPNLFLSGARACPGRSLILIVLKAALASLLSDGPVPSPNKALRTDPLPFSFPA